MCSCNEDVQVEELELFLRGCQSGEAVREKQDICIRSKGFGSSYIEKAFSKLTCPRAGDVS